MKMSRTPQADFFGDIDFWMLNGRLNRDELNRQMREMKTQGIDCFIARTYIGLESDYPGRMFKDMLHGIVETAEQLEMKLFLQAAYMPNAIPADGGYICGQSLKYENGSVRIEENPTFLDVFSPEAVRHYLEHAYGEVWREFEPYFGNVIRSIWVDEPSYPRMKVPWSEFLAEAFRERWHYDPKEHWSKLFTDEDGAETFRCHFYAAVTRQLEKAYFQPLQKWCHDHNLLASGHLLMEDSLYQTLCCGGAMMPFYKYFDIPGIDVLTGEHQFPRTPLTRRFSSPDIYGMMYLTPLQCVSAANQAGRKHILCEMYGVTTENFGPREQKNLFDYFSAFGITRRSVHGLFYSLRGRRKRAYPPHILDYQPYWRDYHELTAECLETSNFVARGEPVRDILVIHPLWSAAALYNYSRGGECLKQYDRKFLRLLVDMTHRHCRFDLGDEETLADQGRVTGTRLTVGKMSYRVVVLPMMRAISGAVLKLLEDFAARGGRIYAVERLPELLDGVPARERIAAALASAEIIESIDALPSMIDDYSLETDDPAALLIQQRREGDKKLFFIFNTDFQNPRPIRLRIDGMEILEQRAGQLHPLPGGEAVVPEGGSIRVVARPGRAVEPVRQRPAWRRTLALPGPWELEGRDRPNVLLLEFARFRAGADGEWSSLYPILAIQQILTERNYRGPVELKYEIVCTRRMTGIELALEEAEAFSCSLNGQAVSGGVTGYYLTRDFPKIALPALHPGSNELLLRREFAPLGRPTDALASLYEKLSGCELENCCLLGDFAVECRSEFTLTNTLRLNRRCRLRPEEKFFFGSLTENGYPFYAGRVRLGLDVMMPDDCPEQVLLKLPCPDAASVTVALNGKRQGFLAWYPYELLLTGLRPGRNRLTLELAGTLRNLLGPFHRPQGEYGSCFDGYSCPNLNWVGIREVDGTPVENWFDHRDVESGSWCESYQQVRFGIRGAPVIEFE